MSHSLHVALQLLVLSAAVLERSIAPPPPTTLAPCDLFAEATPPTPCVAAHSVVRALYAHYDGPLYTVQRTSTNETLDIHVLAPGGYANAPAQERFCNGTTCIISRIWDQSPNQNHLLVEGPGHSGKQCRGVNASSHPVSVGGHALYGAYFVGAFPSATAVRRSF